MRHRAHKAPVLRLDINLSVDDQASNLLPRIVVLHPRLRGIDLESASLDDRPQLITVGPTMCGPIDRLGNAFGKARFICRERQIVRVSRVPTSMTGGQPN